MPQKILIAALCIFLCSFRAQAAPPVDDNFIAGFASAVLENDFHLQSSTLTVDHGVIRLMSSEIAAADRQRVVSALKKINGVTAVEIVDTQPATRPSAANQATAAPGGQGVQTILAPQQWTLFSPTNVFSPLLADPRWPHFSAAYDRSIGSNTPHRDAGDVSFGESLSIFQATPEPAGKLELGLQAAVFAAFDLNAASKDLVNADYFFGPIAEYRHGDVSGFLRVFHQSSHLGDEFLLDHPGITRVNLSYEEVDGVVACEMFNKALRIYGGGGYLFDVDPANLKRGVIQYGAEYRGPRIFPSTAMIPVAAIDIQDRQQNDWSPDFSVRLGVEFQNPAALGRRVDLLLQYYNGHSPNGQFFLQKTQTLGLGLHFYL